MGVEVHAQVVADPLRRRIQGVVTDALEHGQTGKSTQHQKACPGKIGASQALPFTQGLGHGVHNASNHDHGQQVEKACPGIGGKPEAYAPRMRGVQNAPAATGSDPRHCCLYLSCEILICLQH